MLGQRRNPTLGEREHVRFTLVLPDARQTLFQATSRFCSWASAQVHYYENIVSEFQTKVTSFHS